MTKKRPKLDKQQEQAVVDTEGVVQSDNPSPIVFYPDPDLIPTGSTLANLALSDNPYGGWRRGSIGNLVGDRDTGKTFLALNMFAEANLLDYIDDFSFDYDEPEQKLDIPMELLFGEHTVNRINTDDASELIEDFYLTIERRLKKAEETPFIYVLDSFDSLSDAEEMKKTELKRDYPAKPRLASELFRKVKRRIRQTGSFLLVVSQVRQNIGVMIGDKYARSGGKALGHYATQEAWVAVIRKLKKKDRQNGVHVKFKTKKNHYNGKLREVEFDIVHNYGVDDIGSMIDWMVKEGFWKKKDQSINTGDDFYELMDEASKQFFSVKANKNKKFKGATKERLSRHIDENNLENELIQIVANCWKEIEDSLIMDRKKKYK